MNGLGLMWVKAIGTPTIANCRDVGRALQSYLDGEVDETTKRRIARHLDVCRRCGMDAATYRQMKEALRRRAGQLDHSTVERLRAFAEDLAAAPP